jgi:hypothetical protein
MALNPESWLRRQLWRVLWQGPGAISVYVSIPTPLICVVISLIYSSQLALICLFILSANVALGVLFILADEIGSCRHHNLGLLRFSAAKSRTRIERLGVKSKEVYQFLNSLWLDHELELSFRKTRVRSVELLVLALDLLSRLASRYGRGGRRVFEANQAPIVDAIRLLECLPVAEAEKVLVDPLKFWLRDSPAFDPEGWALPLLRKF